MAETRVKTLANDGAYFAGDGYTLLNNTWGRRDLVNGADYVQTIDYGPTLEGVLFSWDWPEVQPRHVLAYPEVFIGKSPWSGLGAPGDLPIRLSAIDSLTASFDLDWGGDAGGFNVSFDLWLSSDPAGGRDAITHEIMIWLKPADFSPAGRIVETVSVPGLTADFRFKNAEPDGWPAWTYAAFQSRSEIREGRIDIGALLDHLEAEGVATPDLWLMDVELGAEIVGGAGWMRIDGFSVDLNSALTQSGTVSEQLMAGGSPYDFLSPEPGLSELMDLAF